MSSGNGNMSARFMLVTPELATKWLEKDKGIHHNRPLKSHKVMQYAKDMKEGRWLVNHQGIAFGPDGEILDGQHRLWAVLESGVSIEFLVTNNMAVEAQRTVDDHIKRSAIDVLTIESGATGIVENLHAAIANRMMHGNKHLQVPTRQETIAYLTRHFEAIDFTIAAFGRKKVRGITRAPVLAPIARAWYSHPHDKLNRFANILVTGDYEDKAVDDGPRRWRDWLLRALSMSTTPSPELVYSKTERVLFGFLKGETHGGKIYEAADELFPIDTDNQRLRMAAASRTRHLRRLKAEVPESE